MNAPNRRGSVSPITASWRSVTETLRIVIPLLVLSFPMLVTPPHFLPLHAPQSGAHEHIFVFRVGALLVREADFSLPDEAACIALGVPLSEARAVGMLGEHYCRTAWVEPAAAEPGNGFAFRPLRSLFGAIDNHLAAVAGRALQIAEWARTHWFC